MMKLKNNLKFILLTLVAIISISCLDDSVTDFGTGPIIVQFTQKELLKTFSKDASGKVYDLEIPIGYVGLDNTPLSKDVTLTIGVNTSESTAIEGAEFSLPETSFTIPAGTNTATISLKVNSANLDPSEPKIVALEILDSSESFSDNRNIILITLQAICSTESLAGNWTYTDGFLNSVTIIENDQPGTYRISNLNNFLFLGWIDISNVCGTMKVIGSNETTIFGSPTSGEGVVSADNNTIQFKYNARFLNNETMTLQRD